MTIEQQIMKEFENHPQIDVISNHGDYFMSLCKDAAKFIPDENIEETANNIYDWLANGCEFNEECFDAETLANDYIDYWE